MLRESSEYLEKISVIHISLNSEFLNPGNDATLEEDRRQAGFRSSSHLNSRALEFFKRKASKLARSFEPDSS